MSLVVDISLNRTKYIGELILWRMEGGVGKDNIYKCSVVTAEHPLTGQNVNVKDVMIEHHYNDSPLLLIRKLIDAVLEPEPEAEAEEGADAC